MKPTAFFANPFALAFSRQEILDRETSAPLPTPHIKKIAIYYHFAIILLVSLTFTIQAIAASYGHPPLMDVDIAFAEGRISLKEWQRRDKQIRLSSKTHLGPSRSVHDQRYAYSGWESNILDELSRGYKSGYITLDEYKSRTKAINWARSARALEQRTSQNWNITLNFEVSSAAIAQGAIPSGQNTFSSPGTPYSGNTQSYSSSYSNPYQEPWATYSGIGNPKDHGLGIQLRCPSSWMRAEGKHPHVLQSLTSTDYKLACQIEVFPNYAASRSLSPADVVNFFRNASDAIRLLSPDLVPHMISPPRLGKLDGEPAVFVSYQLEMTRGIMSATIQSISGMGYCARRDILFTVGVSTIDPPGFSPYLPRVAAGIFNSVIINGKWGP